MSRIHPSSVGPEGSDVELGVRAVAEESVPTPLQGSDNLTVPADATTKGDAARQQDPSLLVAALVSLVAGLCYGTAVYKCGVVEISMLRDQFLMRDSTMLKIFLTGAASSTAVRAAFAARDDARARTAGSEYVGAQTGVPATLAGSFMVGVGMAVAGGCPSLAYAQVGAGMERALISLTGLAAGVLAYSLTAERFAPWVAWKRLSPRFSTMSTILAVRPWVAGAAVAAAFLGVAFVLEWVSPTVDGWGWGPRDARWHPIFCGLFVGLPQMPLTMALSKNIGASSSLLTLMAAASYPWSRGHPVMSAKLHGMRNWWQVIYVAGIFLAPLLWRLVVDAPRQGVYDWGVVVEGLVGGVVGGFGARLAGGCTSAHGISGNGHLASISMLATVGIFLGGIAAAFALYA